MFITGPDALGRVVQFGRSKAITGKRDLALDVRTPSGAGDRMKTGLGRTQDADYPNNVSMGVGLRNDNILKIFEGIEHV